LRLSFHGIGEQALAKLVPRRTMVRSRTWLSLPRGGG
jgi:hypothetical protein